MAPPKTCDRNNLFLPEIHNVTGLAATRPMSTTKMALPQGQPNPDFLRPLCYSRLGVCAGTTVHALLRHPGKSSALRKLQP